MNTGNKPSGAARLPNGTNPSMCMYQVRGTRWGASLGGKGGFQCASPIPFLLFCGPSYYWEAVCLKKPFFFLARLSAPRGRQPFRSTSKEPGPGCTEKLHGLGWPGTRGGGTAHPFRALGQLDAAGTPSGADPRMGQAGMLQGCSCLWLPSPSPVPHGRATPS